MARRRELADVGDGMTGHVLLTVQAGEFPWEDRLGNVYAFDLLTGTVSPLSRRLERFAHEQRDAFARHLAARAIPRDWAVSAALTIEFGAHTAHEQSLVVCRAEVIDDLQKRHTSTRRGAIWHPASQGLRGWLRSVVTRRDRMQQ